MFSGQEKNNIELGMLSVTREKEQEEWEGRVDEDQNRRKKQKSIRRVRKKKAIDLR